MVNEFTYAESGVDRELRSKSKSHLNFDKTHKFRKVIKLPYNTIYPIGNDKYQDHVIEGVGTKVLLAQLANKYDTIGIDAVAMAVNDIIRSGATPISLTDNIDIQKSDQQLLGELTKGIISGAKQTEVAVTSGEIADVKELITGISDNPFHIVCSCVGGLTEKEIIWGNKLESGDVIIGLRSSGLHSNGISLARRILLKKWGGKYDAFYIPDGFDREIIYETLEPTKIYVKPFLKVAKEFEIKAAVHITGDAYLKFDKLMKFNPGIGFEFDNIEPLPIFELIEKTASGLNRTITTEEMFKTFNMGFGFSLIVAKDYAEDVISKLLTYKIESNKIGSVNNTKKIVIKYENKKIQLL